MLEAKAEGENKCRSDQNSRAAIAKTNKSEAESGPRVSPSLILCRLSRVIYNLQCSSVGLSAPSTRDNKPALIFVCSVLVLPSLFFRPEGFRKQLTEIMLFKINKTPHQNAIELPPKSTNQLIKPRQTGTGDNSPQNKLEPD